MTSGNLEIPTYEDALVQVIRNFAARGRAIRESRESEQEVAIQSVPAEAMALSELATRSSELVIMGEDNTTPDRNDQTA